ncbi:MAG: EAL domain-containing protein, partial [Coriobacteriales bacterium]|nr:EAL domain-containing protein [Coriobacteriales bacterium]
QVQRFQALGFPVWMDDFGSGYSSLNALHSIKFDLIKFDMSFMRRLDEGEEDRIILTELMRMANSLGVDTVCEGVETKEQIRFLQEIGCSKLQGYYFGKPMPIQTIRNLHDLDVLLTEENPEESQYYESIGRVNLFDLGGICGEDQNALQHTFSTIPTAIMEVKDDVATYVRSSSSYRELTKRIFGIDVRNERVDLGNFNLAHGTAFVLALRKCCKKGGRTFFDERLYDGSVIHSFVRRLAVNPVTGSVAITLAVLSVSDASQSASLADIAKIAALSANFMVLYTIDPQTGRYTEHSSSSEFDSLGLARSGNDFFADVVRDAPTAIDPADMERHLRVLTKDNVMREIQRNGLFVHNYRLLLDGKSVPVSLRATLANELDGQKIILGVNRVCAEKPTALELPGDYVELLRENEQLKNEAAAQRVSELKESVSSRLTNMPGMTFTKDVATGRYLACNQSFAEYANKKTPEEVVGLTDFQIFDPQTAEHFVEDDKKALSMDTAHVFFEDVRDGAGQQKQFQTTKLKFIDNAGRQCLLGLCLDVTDAVRVRRERDTTQMAYEEARDTSVIFTNIAQALAHDCTDLYYVNMANDEFIEYHSDNESGGLTEVRRGADFFERCERDARLFIHPDDQAAFVEAMDPEFLAKAFEKGKVFELVYRKTKGRTFFHVRMTVTQMEDDKRFIVIAVSDVDELMRQRQAQARIEEEHVVYSRLHALTGNYSVVYLVDPATGRYREFSSTPEFSQTFARAKEGADFFVVMREATRDYCHSDDVDRVLSLLDRQNMLEEIERSGIFSLGYRILTGGRPKYYMLKAALVEEKEGPRLVVGLVNIDSQVRQEKNYRRQLAQANMKANVDALTGVKNKRAYVEEEQRLNLQIMERLQPEFALVILDVNDLKKVNDTAGHQMGDRYLRDACKIVCDIFAHSPVFRIGGDEFAVVSQGEDYERVDELVHSVAEHNKEALRTGGVVVACGMARFEDDEDVAAVFKRADKTMYLNKCALKESR